MRRFMFVLFLAIATSPAAAQRGEVRSDAQIYFNAEQALRRAEDEAAICAWYPDILHRVIDLRSSLRRLERFANRDGALDPLQSAAQQQDEQRICIGVIRRHIEPNMQAARRDIGLLQQRARRSSWRDPYLVTD